MPEEGALVIVGYAESAPEDRFRKWAAFAGLVGGLATDLSVYSNDWAAIRSALTGLAAVQLFQVSREAMGWGYRGVRIEPSSPDFWGWLANVNPDDHWGLGVNYLEATASDGAAISAQFMPSWFLVVIEGNPANLGEYFKRSPSNLPGEVIQELRAFSGEGDYHELLLL